MPLTTTDRYRAQLLNARPTQTVVMLYDNAIASLESAIAAIESGEIERRCNSVNAASEIVSTLHLALDMERGGEIAERLSAIYRYAIGKMISINLHNDKAAAEDLVRALVPLRDAWAELDRMIAAGAQGDRIEPTMLRASRKASLKLAINPAA